MNEQIQINDNVNYRNQNNLQKTFENKLYRHESKKRFEDFSSESSSEDNIEYYENFLKSLINENRCKTPNFSPNVSYKKNKKKNHLTKEFKRRLKKNNSKDYQMNDNVVILGSNKDDSSSDNSIQNFFKIRPKSTSKNLMKNKLSIEDSPKNKKREIKDSVNKKNNKYILNIISDNKIYEVDESFDSNKINPNDIIKYNSHQKPHSSFFQGEKNNNNNNNTEEINQKKQYDVKFKFHKIDKKEMRKCNTINPFIKETDDNINIKNDNNTSRNNNNNNNNNLQFSIPIKKKKKLLCCCIPIG